ncbi:cilia- and flagella-associated protein 276 isoform X1 [Lepisosteus oculatus]|uniref:cilia- and flagella-associated protein 276 isoform X1 n=1 Tax=Lepisosteus oculatus TaxID=7918 RepID=UPI003719FC80
MPRSRDPFPYPKYENDDTFIGKPKNCQKVPYSKPTHLAQNEDPWNRLNARATLSSARREVLYFDPEVPQDRLDFQLKSLYDHHEEFLKDKNETLYQRETFTEDHGRILKNRVKEKPPQPELQKLPIKFWVSPQKASIYSIEGTIESHHNASTNRGYSRKQDGGFYST